MSRVRKASKAGEDRKYSITVPSELNARLEKEMSSRSSCLGLSQFVRQILEQYVEEATEGAIVSKPDAELQAGLSLASELTGLPPAGVVQALIARHLPDFIEEARASRQRLTDVLGKVKPR